MIRVVIYSVLERCPFFNGFAIECNECWHLETHLCLGVNEEQITYTCDVDEEHILPVKEAIKSINKRTETMYIDEESLGKPILKYTSIVPLGKYQGLTFAELLEIDLKYLTWFRDNVTTYKLDKEIIEDIDTFNRLEGERR